MSPLCALALLLAAFAPGAVVSGAEPVSGADGAAPVGEGAVRPAFEPGLASEVQRLRVAAELRSQGRFAEAAGIYEELYKARAAAELLLAAARTRAAAGQHAHALVYLSQLVASGALTAAETQVAYSELQMAQRSVTSVTVRAQMPLRLDDAAPRLRAEFLAQTMGEQRPPLEFVLPSAGTGSMRAVIVQLDPGPWRLRVEEPGLARVDLLIEVGTVPGEPLQLDLRVPADGLPQPQRRRLVGALVGLGGVTLGAGVGVTVRDAFSAPVRSSIDLNGTIQVLALSKIMRNGGTVSLAIIDAASFAQTDVRYIAHNGCSSPSGCFGTIASNSSDLFSVIILTISGNIRG